MSTTLWKLSVFWFFLECVKAYVIPNGVCLTGNSQSRLPEGDYLQINDINGYNAFKLDYTGRYCPRYTFAMIYRYDNTYYMMNVVNTTTNFTAPTVNDVYTKCNTESIDNVADCESWSSWISYNNQWVQETFKLTKGPCGNATYCTTVTTDAWQNTFESCIGTLSFPNKGRNFYVTDEYMLTFNRDSNQWECIDKLIQTHMDCVEADYGKTKPDDWPTYANILAKQNDGHGYYKGLTNGNEITIELWEEPYGSWSNGYIGSKLIIECNGWSVSTTTTTIVPITTPHSGNNNEFTFSLMDIVLISSGGLVLLVIIVMIAVCVHNKRKKHLADDVYMKTLDAEPINSTK